MFVKLGFVTQTLKVPKKLAIVAKMIKCGGRTNKTTGGIQTLTTRPEMDEIEAEVEDEAEVEVMTTATMTTENLKVNLFLHLLPQLLIKIMVAA